MPIAYLLFPDLRATDSLCPNHTFCVLQLCQDLAGIGRVVVMDDDADFLVSLGLGDGSPTQDGYFGDGGSGDHGMKHGTADEPSRAGEDEMHGAE